MMKVRSEILSVVIAVVLSVAFLPFMASASSVPWTSEQYMAEALVTPVYGPPLPISDNYTFGYWDNSHSEVTDTSMFVDSRSRTTDMQLWAKASFSGTYSAIGVDPTFQFIYDGTYTSQNPQCFLGPPCSERYAWLTVSDLTNSTILYDNQYLTLDGSYNVIEVLTLAGHDISVSFGAYVFTTSDGLTGDNYEEISLNYSTAIVPEPISSILFVTGGSLLAGRRYLRRKNRA